MKAWLSQTLQGAARHPYLAVFAALVLALGVAAWRVGPGRLFLTPDQRGRTAFAHGRYDEAAKAFRNPMWVGAAEMKAKDFKAAAQTFCGLDSAASNYDCGNAFVMLGKYDDAMKHYDRALELKPDFADAEANRTLAKLRAARMIQQEGQLDTDPEDMGSRDERPERTGTTDQKRQEEAPETTTGMSDESVRALWLKRVESRPADFLRSRFAYQLEADKPAPPKEGDK
jgi:Ca-activated chloride channel homolog